MDYTLHELRPLIYKDKEDIDCFNIDDEKALDAAMLELIDKSSIVELDGANNYILEIFNNAYYITTLILMEKRPLHYFRKYINIAEHTGSSSDDISGRNTFFEEFSSFTMAMVCNYLRLLDDKYNDEDNLFIKKLTEHFKKFFKPTSTKEDAYSIFTSNLMSLEVLNNYNVDRNSFAPRKIDEQAINDTKEHFRRKYSSWSEMITNCDFKSNDNFIKGICRTEEEKTILAAAFRKEREELDLRAMGVFATQVSPFPPVQHIENTKQEQQHEEVQQNTAESEARIKELEAQVEELTQKIRESSTELPWIDWLDGAVFHQSINAEEIYKFLRNTPTPHLKDRARCYVLYRVLAEIKALKKNVNQKDILKWWNAHFECGWHNDNQFKFTDLPENIKSKDIPQWQRCVGNNNQYYYEFSQTLINSFAWIKGGGKYEVKSAYLKRGSLPPK